MFVNKYPYTDMHELNLDWLLGQMLQLRTDMKDFINQNMIKYADPIQWNITTQYESNTVVIEPNSGNAYISSQPVPAGVAISNTDYWSVIGNFSVLYESIKESIAADDDGSNINATEARTEGQLLWLNSILYKVLSDISVGALYITSGTGQNLQEVTIEELLNKETEDRIEAVENLENVIMSSIMAIQGNIPKDLNWIKPETFGAVGDGVNDDTEALQACFDYAEDNGKNVLLTKTYKITGQIFIPSNIVISGYGSVITYVYVGSSYNDSQLFCLTDCENVKIEGITFKGSGAKTSSYDITICIGGFNASYIDVVDCKFLDSPTIGCIFFHSSNHITVEGCLIKEYTYSAIFFAEGSSFITVRNNTVINGNYEGSSHIRYAISLQGWVTDPPHTVGQYLIAEYNYISDTIGFWEGIDCHGGNYITIAHNTILGCANPISVFSSSEQGFAASNADIHDNYCYTNENNLAANANYGSYNVFKGTNFLIHDNQFFGSMKTTTNYTGIILSGNTISFYNNTVSHGSKYSLFIGGDLRTPNLYIRNNKIAKVGSYASSALYATLAGAINPIITAIVEGNLIDGFATIYGAGSDITMSNCYIRMKGNTYNGTTAAYGSYNGIIADYVNPANLTSYQSENGQIAQNAVPSAGSYIGYVRVSNAWKGYGLIQS